ncbi:UNVERIFIED_CONTAM: hypothetical protein PYX00_010518 [Menopon gallinae]|uniref:Splicing factor 3B subunit 4 n=1 Tax=Menopon gallinae TaxID=328185 RepID=A0AAW2HG34_9NEOP
MNTENARKFASFVSPWFLFVKMAAGPIAERNQDATIYVGGLDDKVTEPLMWELFVQSGPVVNVHMPKDRVTQMHQGYGFVEFMGEEDADYAIKIMNMIKLYGKPIRVNKASAHQKNLDVGANIFIGNLDPEVDEKLLFDTFSAFGVILQTPKIMRDPESGNSKGFAFINFASFEASDASIEAMNGQYLCNRPISVSYAFKKDSRGERHGSAAERLLAAQNPLSQADRPHQLFADAPPPAPLPPPTPMMMVPPPPNPPPPPPVPPPMGMPPPPPMPGMNPPLPPTIPPPGMEGYPPHMTSGPPGPPGIPPAGMPPPPRMMPPGSIPPWQQQQTYAQGNYAAYSQAYGPPPSQQTSTTNNYMPPPGYAANSYGGPPPSWMPPPPPSQMASGMPPFGPPGPMPPFPPPPAPAMRPMRSQNEEY